MKIAILADIHANLVALHTIADHLLAWKPDVVVVAGDIVNRGPRSRECLNFVLHKQKTEGWLTVKGNHEDYVINFANPETAPTGRMFDLFQVAYSAYRQLNGQVAVLQELPFHVDVVTPAPGNFRVTHASMLGNRNGIFPHTTATDLRKKIQPAPAVFCAGHTHIPLTRWIDDTLVVNAGAVGLPFDGDHRASYAQVQWQNQQWSANIVRLEYDRAQAEKDFIDTGFLDEGGPVAHLILDELRTAHSRLYQWTIDYQPAVLDGSISLEDAVNQFLTKMNGRMLA
jgi:predicted phosphodiesterase